MKALLLLILSVLSVFGAPVGFAWSANTETNLGGYRLYYGPAAGLYTNSVRLGLVTNYSMQIGGKQYFTLTAFSTNGTNIFESEKSTELFFNPPITPTNFIFSLRLITEEACDFVLWEPILTNTITPSFPLAFYRLRIQ